MRPWRFESSLRHHTLHLLPIVGLLLALATVFLFSGDRDRFYRSYMHDFASAKTMAHAEGLSPARPFLFHQMNRRDNGTLRYDVYNRFPIGGFVLIKLAILPFTGDFGAQVAAARWMMLVFYCAAALLAYCALTRLALRLGAPARRQAPRAQSPMVARLVAASAVLLAFSSYPMLRYADMISTEASPDLFAVMLGFHGMVLFQQERRFVQLLVKVCAALLLGWHVVALLGSFLVLVLAGEVVKAARRGPGRGLLAAIPARALRSRHAKLAVAAGLFGAGVLAFQFAAEGAAFDGQRSLTELPSVKSMFKRFGGNPTVNAMIADQLHWPNFLAMQFHRVGAASIPYIVPTPRNAFGELPWGAPGDPSLAPLGVAATALGFGGLVAIRRWRDGRLLLGTLAMSGFAWAFLMRHQTAELAHGFEAMYFVGIALALFTLLLVGTAKVAGTKRAGRLVGGLGVGAAAVFALSSWRMSAAAADAQAAATERAIAGEFETVRMAVRGKDVLVPRDELSVYRFLKAPSRARHRHWSVAMVDSSARHAFHYYMTGSVLRYAEWLDGPAGAAPAGSEPPRPDFVLAFERFDVPSLRTPRHRFVFLYDAPDVLAAMVDARRREFLAIVAGSGEQGGVEEQQGGWMLKSSSAWHVHAKRSGAAGGPAELAFLKQPCVRADTLGRYYLQVLPLRETIAPFERGEDGLVALHLGFADHGVAFEDTCLMRRPLPPWPVGTVRSGQFGPGRAPLVWRTAFYMDSERLRQAHRAVRGLAPAARGAFDVHWRAGRVTYIREPCALKNVASRFFLHAVPADIRDLPAARRRAGFLSLDFDFRERGELQGDRCVAVVELPGYPVQRVRTGQFRAALGELWRVEIGPAGAR